MGVQETFSVMRYGFNRWRPEYQGTWVHYGWDHGSKPIHMVYRTRDIVVFKIPGDRGYMPTYLSVQGILHEDSTEIKTVDIADIPVRTGPITLDEWRKQLREDYADTLDKPRSE
jgi:hypothetical protein